MRDTQFSIGEAEIYMQRGAVPQTRAGGQVTACLHCERTRCEEPRSCMQVEFRTPKSASVPTIRMMPGGNAW